LLVAIGAQAAQPATVEKLLKEATTAFNAGQSDKALELSGQAVAADPKDARARLVRGRIHARLDQSEKAILDFDSVTTLDPGDVVVYQYRGIEHFKLGSIDASIADFDRYIAGAPQSEPHHWQRGISYYYAGRYADGVKQFTLHQTVNANDVENAVWHFICEARATGLDAARKGLIPIQGDSRVPMRQVHDLFAGKAEPESVLEAARMGKGDSLERNLFYAHLYLGLYYEALKDEARARDHIMKAAARSKDQDYMGAVARVHAARLKASGPQ
jgi:lipoprotein NlpI